MVYKRLLFVLLSILCLQGMSWASYSELENRSPKMNSDFVGGVFAEFEFGDSRLFSIRPEVDWLVRGTKINDSDLDYLILEIMRVYVLMYMQRRLLDLYVVEI